MRSNWLRVSDTAERSQVDQRIGHQFHAIVPLLDAFKAEQQPLELIFPRKGPLDTHPQGMDGGVEQPLAPALGVLAVAGVLFDVGDHPRIKNALTIRFGVNWLQVFQRAYPALLGSGRGLNKGRVGCRQTNVREAGGAMTTTCA